MKKYIDLYHYSNKNITGKLSPDFFGDNSYTAVSNRLSPVKRLYFYIDPKDVEISLKSCRYIYKSKIAINKLYNIIDDKLSLGIGDLSFNEILRKVKALKYSGIYGNVNGKYKIVFLFNSIKAEKIRG